MGLGRIKIFAYSCDGWMCSRSVRVEVIEAEPEMPEGWNKKVKRYMGGSQTYYYCPDCWAAEKDYDSDPIG